MAKDQAKVKFIADTEQFEQQLKRSQGTLASLRSEMRLNEAEFKNSGNAAEYLKQKQSILNSELEANKQKQDALTSKIEVAKSVYGENSTQVQNLTSSLNRAKTEEENLKNSLSKVETEMSELNAETERANSPLAQLTATINSQESELDQLKTKYKNVALEEGKNSTAAQELKSKIDSLDNELGENKAKLNEVEKAVESAGKKAETSSKGWTVLKGTLANLASAGIQKAIQSVKDFAGSIIETGEGFDTSMSQVAATMGTTVDEIDNMKQAAMEMGATTEWTSTEAGDALNYLALAGYDSDQAISTLPTVLNLASAGAMDLGAASDMVTDAMTALGIEADAEGKNITTFGDQMARTASKSNTNVSQLGEAILTIGATAKNLSGGTVELNTALGILADNSIKGAEGGTHLRNILLALNPTTNKARDAWDSLGVSAYDADGNMRPLQDTFADLNKAMEGMTNEEKSQILTKMFNKTDLASINALLGTSSDRWEQLGSAIDDSGGAMADMAATQLDNLQGDLTLMSSALDGLKQNIYTGIEPTLRSVVGTITNDIIPAISNSVTWCKEHSTLLGILAGVIGVVGVAYGVFSAVQAVKTAMNTAEVTSIGALISAKYASAAASMAALAPYILIVAAITAVIAIIVLCVKHWDQIKAKVTEVTNSIKNSISSKWNSIKTTISSVVDGIKTKVVGVFNGIKTTVSTIWNGVKTAITHPIETASNIVTKAIDKIKSVINNCKPKLGIKIPHISVSGGKAPFGIGGKGSLPSFKVTWNALGKIFKKPTIFATSMGYQGVGEAGPEAVAPIGVLQNYVRDAVASAMQFRFEYDKLAAACISAIERLDLKIEANDREIGRLVRRYT